MSLRLAKSTPGRIRITPTASLPTLSLVNLGIISNLASQFVETAFCYALGTVFARVTFVTAS